MTYDELLDKIYWYWTWANADDSEFHGWGGYRKTLHAIVELHMPDIPYDLHEAIEVCPIDGDVYPCKTIQAIEKELG